VINEALTARWEGRGRPTRAALAPAPRLDFAEPQNDVAVAPARSAQGGEPVDNPASKPDLALALGADTLKVHRAERQSVGDRLGKRAQAPRGRVFAPKSSAARRPGRPPASMATKRMIVSLRPPPGCRSASSLLSQMRSTQIK